MILPDVAAVVQLVDVVEKGRLATPTTANHNGERHGAFGTRGGLVCVRWAEGLVAIEKCASPTVLTFELRKLVLAQAHPPLLAPKPTRTLDYK